jgi:hypothetical protein
LHAFSGETITFFEAVGQKGLHIGSKCSQHTMQERYRSDPVYIVVTVQNDHLPAVDRLKDPLDSRSDSTDFEWVAQIAQSWKQKLTRFSFLHQAYSRKNTRQARRKIQLSGNRQRAFQLHRVRKEPQTVHRNSFEFCVLRQLLNPCVDSFLKELLKTQNPKLETQN